jgi:hypothetical protein
MARCAAILRHYAGVFMEHRIYGIKGIADYLDTPGYGYRYDPDNPLNRITDRIGRIGARLAGIRTISHREFEYTQPDEKSGRTGDLLMDIANSLSSVRTGGEPVGIVDRDGVGQD